MHYWSLQDAKAKLSELIRRVNKEGPFGISVRGKEEVVILTKTDYDLLMGKKPTFVEFMAESPLKGLPVDLSRDKSLPREIDL